MPERKIKDQVHGTWSSNNIKGVLSHLYHFSMIYELKLPKWSLTQGIITRTQTQFLDELARLPMLGQQLAFLRTWVASQASVEHLDTVTVPSALATIVPAARERIQIPEGQGNPQPHREESTPTQTQVSIPEEDFLLLKAAIQTAFPRYLFRDQPDPPPELLGLPKIAAGIRVRITVQAFHPDERHKFMTGHFAGQFPTVPVPNPPSRGDSEVLADGSLLLSWLSLRDPNKDRSISRHRGSHPAHFLKMAQLPNFKDVWRRQVRAISDWLISLIRGKSQDINIIRSVCAAGRHRSDALA
jgi:hypothetical protein